MLLTKDVDWAPSLHLEINSIGKASVERTNRSVRRQNVSICSTMSEDGIYFIVMLSFETFFNKFYCFIP
jgi:hypothetical protein